MTAGLGWGALIGAGICVAVVALRPARPSLATALRRLDGAGERPAPLRIGGGWVELRASVSQRVAVAAEASGVPLWRLGPDLAAAGMSLADLVGEALVASLGGAALPWVAEGILATGGAAAPPAAIAGMSVLLALSGLAVPASVLRSRAARRRAHMRRALSAFCDLVALALAGGAGVEGALEAPGIAAGDWAMARLSQAITEARLSGLAPWDGLATLGAELGVAELAELGANLALAGTEGARVRTTLRARATSLRRHELDEAEAEANSVTERMFLPGTLLLAGFMVFLGYPAMARVFNLL